MLGSIQSTEIYIEKLKNELTEKKKEIENLKKENVILRNLLEKYNIVNIDEVVKNLDISEVSKKDNKRNSVYYDTKEEIINENDKTCLKCDEETILGNIYCIKHKMEVKHNSNNKNIPENKNLNDVEKVNIKNISEEKDMFSKDNPIDISLPAVEITDTQTRNTIGKNRNRRSDKTLPILDRYPITVYDDIGNSSIKQLIAKETELIICYKNDIADKIKKNIDNITINDVVDYIAKHDKLSYQKKGKIKYLFERCEYLYKQYGQFNKLNKFKFNIGSLPHMNKNEWKEWVSELDKLVKIHYSDENICQHIMANNSKRPGEICGKINCKNHNIS